MKQILLLLLLFSGIFSSTLFGQISCDTLLCKDGRRIHEQIQGSESDGILYSLCGDNTGKQYFIEKAKVQTILFQTTPEKDNKDSKPANNSLFNRSTPKNYTDKTTVVIWAGLSLTDGFQYDTELEKFSGFQFGSQVNLKNKPFQLGIMFRPLSHSGMLGVLLPGFGFTDWYSISG